jgi:hypothetical protein
MRRVTCEMRARLEMQGFVGLSDETIRQVVYWLRLTPAVIVLWVAVGVSLGSAPVLWALAPFMAAGVVLPWHPFDALYQFFIRHRLGTVALPPAGRPRRLTMALAVVWLLATGWCFQTGAIGTARVLGLIQISVSGTQAVTGFCIPSFVYQQVARLWSGRRRPGAVAPTDARAARVRAPQP